MVAEATTRRVAAPVGAEVVAVVRAGEVVAPIGVVPAAVQAGAGLGEATVADLERCLPLGAVAAIFLVCSALW